MAVVEVASLIPTEAIARAPEAAAARAPAPPDPVLMSADRSGLFLQLGAFSSRANAENFRTRIQRSLDWLKQEIEIVLRERLHRVQLGPYQDRKEAALVAERIREALEFRPIVIKR